jgi:hypothetical protein
VSFLAIFEHIVARQGLAVTLLLRKQIAQIIDFVPQLRVGGDLAETDAQHADNRSEAKRYEGDG